MDWGRPCRPKASAPSPRISDAYFCSDRLHLNLPRESSASFKPTQPADRTRRDARGRAAGADLT